MHNNKMLVDFDESQGYNWQYESENNFEIIEKEESLVLYTQKLESERKRKCQKRPNNIRLGMMRYTLLFIDMTDSMKILDLKPTRLSLTIKNAKLFVENYFDQNPISQLGIFTIKNGTVQKLTSLGGNPKKHLDALNLLSDDKCEGELSLENILRCAESILKHIPSYATREVIIIIASLTSCDHDNIDDTIASVEQHSIRCSVIMLSAEVYIYKKLTKATKGKFQVILDEIDLKYSFQNLVLPPPSLKENEACLIHMGFPSFKKFDRLFKLCNCHFDYPRDVSQLYSCPRCDSAYCEVPIECNNCGLILVSAPHLARIYHHLFPLDVFIESEPTTKTMKIDLEKKCSACNKIINNDELTYKCNHCVMEYCGDCDEFLHSSVHVCPNCSEKPIRTTHDAAE